MTPDDDESSVLEQAFQETMGSAARFDPDASWQRFRRYTLPDKQAWVAYSVTRQQAHARLKTLLRHTHRQH